MANMQAFMAIYRENLLRAIRPIVESGGIRIYDDPYYESSPEQVIVAREHYEKVLDAREYGVNFTKLVRGKR